MSKTVSRSQWGLIAGALAIVAVCGVAYASSFRMLLRVWEEPDYSHGYLIPFFSLFLLWFRRDKAPRGQWTGSWWGMALIALSGVLYLAAGMIPLPMAIETMARVPLQRLATVASTYILQTFGLAAAARGNVIQLSEYPINVAEACSGLRMLMTSVALTCGLAFVLDRPIWERLFILASAIPIALAVNIIRVAVTGLCHEFFGVDVAEKVFHDVAGYIMPALAVLMLWLEIEILRRLVIEPDEGQPLAGALAPR